MGRRCLTKIELETVLLEIEGCINSRPLTFVGDELNSERPLTPAKFLGSKPARMQCSVVEDIITSEDLSNRKQECLAHLDQFWSRWQSEYLKILPCSIPKFKQTGSLGVGSIVLIEEDGCPRFHWEMGRVTELLPSRDGRVRAVKLLTRKGERVRPIQRLHDLEVLPVPPSSKGSEEFSDGTDGTSSKNCKRGVLTTRSGRVVKRPQVLTDYTV